MEGLARTTKNKKAKLVGRGGTRGKTSGRGTKGQKARAGHKIRPHIRDTIKKLPKLRGRGKNMNKAFQIKPAIINLAVLEKHFAAGAKITPSVLFEKKLIRREGGTLPEVKILATGAITKKVTLHGFQVSAAAQAHIEAVGGKVYAR